MKSWLLLAGIFVVGAVTGSILTVGLGPYFVHPPGETQMRRHWMEHLTQRLNLSADQQAKIEPILADAETRIQSLHRDEMSRGAEIFKAVHDKISAILTPEQKGEIEKMEREREKIFSGHLHPRGPGPGGPEGMHRPEGPDADMAPPPPPADAPTNAPSPMP